MKLIFYSSTEIWHVMWLGVVCAHMPCFQSQAHASHMSHLFWVETLPTQLTYRMY